MLDLFLRKKPFDHTEGDKRVKYALDLIHKKEWEEFKNFYNTLHPSDRHKIIDCCAHFLSANEPLGCENQEDLEILVLLGGIHARLAFLTRTYAYSEDVKEEDWEKAHTLSQTAHQYLNKALHIDQNDTTIYGFYITADLLKEPCVNQDGEQYINHDNVNKIAQLIRKSPNPPNIFSASALIAYDAPKWFGSIEQMDKTVHDLSDLSSSPSWLALKAYFLYEQWLWFIAFEEDEQTKRNYIDSLDKKPYQNYLNDISRQCWSGINDDNIPEAEKVFAFNQFANIYCRHAMYEKARKHLKAMDKKIMYSPWTFATQSDADIIKSVNKYRLYALLFPL